MCTVESTGTNSKGGCAKSRVLHGKRSALLEVQSYKSCDEPPSLHGVDQSHVHSTDLTIVDCNRFMRANLQDANGAF